MKRKIVYLICISFLLMSLSISSVAAKDANASTKENIVKNVILVVPDGIGLCNMNLGRWYKGGTSLAMDSIV